MEERKKLSQLISQWNVDHYDLFELSQPNEVRRHLHARLRFGSLLQIFLNPFQTGTGGDSSKNPMLTCGTNDQFR